MNPENLTPEILRAGLTMLGLGLGAVAAVFLVGVLTKYAGPLLKERRPLDVTMLAVVEGKRTCMQTESEGHPEKNGTMRFFVTFAPEGEPEVELMVSAEEYAALTEGTRGYLTVQDKQFVSFTSENEVAKA